MVAGGGSAKVETNWEAGMAKMHPRAQLVDELNHPLRLSVLAALIPVTNLPYSELQELLGVDRPTLSKQLTLLHEAGFIERQRWGNAKGIYVTVMATQVGRAAFEQHARGLREIVAAGEATLQAASEVVESEANRVATSSVAEEFQDELAKV